MGNIESAKRFPIHVATSWTGNAPDIARKHYLQTTDEHFERALEHVERFDLANPTVPRSCGALQNPVQ